VLTAKGCTRNGMVDRLMGVRVDILHLGGPVLTACHCFANRVGAAGSPAAPSTGAGRSTPGAGIVDEAGKKAQAQEAVGRGTVFPP
jgi:hypothetical protein